MSESPIHEIFAPGQPLFIPDGKLLENAIAVIVERKIKEYVAQQQKSAEDDAWVEKHVAAEMLGKHPDTLARWAKAGRIERVSDSDKHGREVYYYMRSIRKEMAALAAKKSLTEKEARSE